MCGHDEFRVMCCLNITPWRQTLEDAASVWDAMLKFDPIKALTGTPPWLVPKKSQDKK
jgi:hypothetical protein